MPTYDDLMRQAKTLHDSRLFRTPNAETAFAIVAYGQEIGLGPVSALMNVQIISGKPTLGASGVGALIQRSGRFSYRVVALDDQRAEIAFSERRGDTWEPIGTSSFDQADAKRAGLGASPTWRAYPRAMLFSRALTAGVRQHCPSVTMGSVYDPEELSNVIPAEAGPAPLLDPPMALVNGAAAGPTVSLEGLTAAFGADAVFEAAGGRLPATEADLRAVAEKLAAAVPTVGAAEADEEAGDAPAASI